ncbi:MAG: B12-binding domain-containing radical SAM protein [Deltaproteobacteria bacterium]|nr:B12-binding domain-containing radical SAM protein [Deltaproteobacteria bacterium]
MRVLIARVSQPVPVQNTSPPLGPLWLSTALKREFGNDVEVRFHDLRLDRKPVDALSRIVREFRPDVVGFSALFGEQKSVAISAEAVRQVRPSAHIVVGGPLATVQRERAFDSPAVDAALLGESEFSFPKYVRQLGDSSADAPIPGVTCRGDLSAPETISESPQDLDALGFPDWTEVPFRKHRPVNSMNGIMQAGRVVAPVMTSRGCPYHCTYCHNLMGRRMRARSIDHVIEEIDTLVRDHGVDEIQFVDDIWNYDRRRVLEFCEKIVLRPYRIHIAFPNGVRGDLLDREQIDALKRAGCYNLTFAVESGSDRVQTLLKKSLKKERLMASIEYASSVGIVTKGYFIIGFPTETAAEIDQTVQLAVESKLNIASFFTFTPFPKTPLYDLAVSELGGRVRDLDYDYYSHQSFYALATGCDLSMTQKRAYRRFFTVRRVIRLLASCSRPFLVFSSFAKLSARVTASEQYRRFLMRRRLSRNSVAEPTSA